MSKLIVSRRRSLLIVLSLIALGSASAQEITHLTSWTRNPDAFSGNDSVVTTAPVVGLPGARVTMRISCLRDQNGPKWPSALHFHFGISGAAFDVVNVPIAHEGGSMMNPSLAYTSEMRLRFREKTDTGTPVETTFSLADPRNLDFDSHVEWYVNPATKVFSARTDLMGFSVGGVDVALQWGFAQSAVATFLKNCATPVGAQVPLWEASDRADKAAERAREDRRKALAEREEYLKRPDIQPIVAAFNSNPNEFVLGKISPEKVDITWGLENRFHLVIFYLITTRPLDIYHNTYDSSGATHRSKSVASAETVCAIHGGNHKDQSRKFTDADLNLTFGWVETDWPDVYLAVTCIDPHPQSVEPGKIPGFIVDKVKLDEPFGNWIHDPASFLKTHPEFGPMFNY